MADTDEFDTFYRDTRQRLFTMAYALSGDVGEAEEVVQEAYARTWQRWPTVSGYTDPEAWVRTIARRIAISRWRKARNAITAHKAALDAAYPAMIGELDRDFVGDQSRLYRHELAPRQLPSFEYIAFVRVGDYLTVVRVPAMFGEQLIRDLATKATNHLRSG